METNGKPARAPLSRNQAKEMVVVWVFLLIVLKGVDWLGSVDSFSNYRALISTALLLYVPFLHIRIRKLPIVLVEKNLRDVQGSLTLFLKTSFVIFPLFFLAAHLYQTFLFEFHLKIRIPQPWIPLLLEQVFLVSFPEELCFRGYLQTALQVFFTKKVTVWKWTASVGMLMTSLVFAFSHSVLTLQWWHFAIFFPSLVFGWLREKTNGLVAPVLFHAFSNLLINAIAMSYF